MQHLRRVVLVGFVAALIVACGPSQSASSGQARAASRLALVERGSETILQAFTLLDQNYADSVSSPRLLAAGQRGAWRALAQVGVPPTAFELPPPNSALPESIEAFRERYRRIAVAYGSKIDPVFLAHQMIREAAQSLDDCHTGFLSPEQAAEHAERLSGTARFGGIGVILRASEEQVGVSVVEVFDGGPASKAGIKRGDRIVAVDGQSVAGRNLEQVVSSVRGREGSTIHLGVSRAGADQPLDVAVVRGEVIAPTIRAEILSGKIGYIRLYGFPEPMTAQLDAALQEFAREDVAGVVVDLRDNSGGQLDIVTQVTSRFVDDGALFKQVGQDGARIEYRADGSYWANGRPVVVLVNGGTGSGGEIFASAVREHGAGRLIGTKTSGCVSTGQMYKLADGSALEVATNRVVSGVREAELNKVGLTPDEIVEIFAEDLANDRDPQLDRAIRLLRDG